MTFSPALKDKGIIDNKNIATNMVPIIKGVLLIIIVSSAFFIIKVFVGRITAIPVSNPGE